MWAIIISVAALSMTAGLGMAFYVLSRRIKEIRNEVNRFKKEMMAWEWFVGERQTKGKQ